MCIRDSYLIFKKRILGHFVWSLNEYNFSIGKPKEYQRPSEYVSLVNSLTDIGEYKRYMHENSDQRIHLLTTPKIIPNQTLTNIDSETERFLQMLDHSLNTIPLNDGKAEKWMNDIQSDLSLYYTNKDIEGFMASIGQLHDFLCHTGELKENQTNAFQYYLNKL